MELRQLRYFTAVVQHGGFAVAASELGVTQPALSKSIRVLEQSLGVQLLDRGPTGVRTTIYGEHLVSYAHLILAQVSEAEQELGAMRGARRGVLRIGCIPAALRTVLPVALKAFAEERPNVQLSVTEGLNDALVDALRSGKLDLIVTAQPADPFEYEIDFFILAQEPMDIICNADHPLTRNREVSISDLSGFGWVIPTKLEPDRRNLERLFNAAGLTPPHVVLETTSVMLAQAVLKDSPHLSYLPHSSMPPPSTGFVALPLTSPTWTRTTIVAYRRKGPSRPLLRHFMDELRSAQAAIHPETSAELLRLDR